MPMSIPLLADALKGGLGFGAMATSSETTGFADAVISHIMAAGIVSNAPGTINGAAPPSGGPLIAGVGAGGTISGVAGPALAALMQTKMGKGSITSELLGMATSICTHLMTGLVSFLLITGVCSNTPVSPGALVGGGVGGTISGLSGPTLAALMATSIGQPGPTPQLIQFCTELVNHIMTNATVTYTVGSVVGVCSAGGGPIAAGAGTGGTIA